VRKGLIVANWKMNTLRGEAKALAGEIVRLLEDLKNVDVVLAPPYTSLDVIYEIVRKTGIELGAQNTFWEAKGAFTGEISPYMLADIGCKWVIIGHSERRRVFRETDDLVLKKVRASLEAGLFPIVCVGETLEEKEKGSTINVIEEQIRGGLAALDINDTTRIVIAYEPVWAIGTGKNALPEDVEHVHGVIREIIGGIWGETANRVRILYGGSVDPANIEELVSSPNVDGALVGGASLKAGSFTKIVKITESIPKWK
jgi:triosephosphate isomerase